MSAIIQIFFAIVGIGILIFIHEWGHYWMARRVGMRVETFSIGFGRPIYSWTFQGVKWQLGWFLFGGYVRIAGMDLSQEGNDTFYAKSPWARIKVAFAGPLFNLLFALLLFALLWFMGGREKPFSEYTQRIGWVDPDSKLYTERVVPGDLIQQYNGKPYHGIRDLIYQALLHGSPVTLKGLHSNVYTGSATPFELTVPSYPYPNGIDGMRTYGVLSPASYLFYYNTLPGSPMADLGLQPFDRLLWVDGQLLFSQEQLSQVINAPITLLTVKRGEEIFLHVASKFKAGDLKLTPHVRGELSDWRYEAGINDSLLQMAILPYNLNSENVVEERLSLIDPTEEARLASAALPFADAPLKPGDQIVAIYNEEVATPSELLVKLQKRRLVMIAERNHALPPLVSWQDADLQFDALLPGHQIATLIAQIGRPEGSKQLGELFLFSVEPKRWREFALTEEQQKLFSEQERQELDAIAQVRDSAKRTKLLQRFEEMKSRLMLGVELEDQRVRYNPSPWSAFMGVWQEVWQTLAGLFSGNVSPKWLAGPIGVVQVIQHSWSVGVREATFWMATISINLGLLNLLPIPILDGGYIVIGFFEMITKKRIPPKTLEKLLWPFFLLLIGFFLFVSYYDILRLF